MKQIKYILTICILLITTSLSITSCIAPTASSIEQTVVDEATKNFNLDFTIPEEDEVHFYKALPPTAAINGTVVNITWEKGSKDPFIELSNNVLTANRNIVTVSSKLNAIIEYKGIKGIKTFDITIPPIKSFDITSEFLNTSSVTFLDNKLNIINKEKTNYNKSFDIESIDTSNKQIILKEMVDNALMPYSYKYSISAINNKPYINMVSEYNETSWWKSKGSFINEEMEIDLNPIKKSFYKGIENKSITFNDTFTSFTTDNGEIWDIAVLKNEKALTITKKGSKPSVSYKLVFTPIDFFEVTLTT